MPASRIPGVLGVAPTASHGAPLKPNENRGHADSDTLPLDGEEALGDSASGDESHAPSRLISAKHVGVSRIIARSSTIPEGGPGSSPGRAFFVVDPKLELAVEERST